MKFKILTLTIAFLLIFSSLALATVDFGIMQDYSGRNSFRLDVENFFLVIPTRGNIRSFDMGLKLPVPVGNTYVLSGLNFEGGGNLRYKSTILGIGYPLRWDIGVLRTELKVEAPQWREVQNWGYDAGVSLQFSWGEVFHNFLMGKTVDDTIN